MPCRPSTGLDRPRLGARSHEPYVALLVDRYNEHYRLRRARSGQPVSKGPPPGSGSPGNAAPLPQSLLVSGSFLITVRCFGVGFGGLPDAEVVEIFRILGGAKHDHLPHGGPHQSLRFQFGRELEASLRCCSVEGVRPSLEDRVAKAAGFETWGCRYENRIPAIPLRNRDRGMIGTEAGRV